nr:four helix bundle protein [Prolixibacteraceae bacterium]
AAKNGLLWRKRNYPKTIVSKLIEIEGEASETQIWLAFSKDCGYITEDEFLYLDKEYDKVLGMLVNMRNNKDKWTF